jgi:GTP-binding protein
VVAIVGKPNVGKSALFNRLIGRRKAIVAEEPGVTRDINYERITIDGVTFRLADSAGFGKSRDDISRIVRGLNSRLIDEASLIVFTCDIHGLNGEDFDLADVIRKSGKPCILTVNKADNTRLEEQIYDFFELGFDDPIPVSAGHGRNIERLKERIVRRLTDAVQGKDTGSVAVNPLHSGASRNGAPFLEIAIVGKPNVGKSSLLNLLVQKERSIVDAEPGTTRDSVDETVEFQGETVRFVDTAGLRKRRSIRESVEFYSLVRVERSIRMASVCVHVLDASAGITTQDKKIASIVTEAGRGMIIAANKWDLLAKEEALESRFIDEVYRIFPHIGYVDVVPVSAQTGFNIIRLLINCIKVYNNYNIFLKTSEINGLLGRLSLGQRGVKYGYQRSTAPPHFEFFVRNVDPRDSGFKRYLSNTLREQFGLRGIPVEITLRRT